MNASPPIHEAGMHLLQSMMRCRSGKNKRSLYDELAKKPQLMLQIPHLNYAVQDAVTTMRLIWRFRKDSALAQCHKDVFQFILVRMYVQIPFGCPLTEWR